MIKLLAQVFSADSSTDQLFSSRFLKSIFWNQHLDHEIEIRQANLGTSHNCTIDNATYYVRFMLCYE